MKTNTKKRTVARYFAASLAAVALSIGASARAQLITDGLVVYLNLDSNIVAQAGTTNSGTATGFGGVPVYTNGVTAGGAAIFANDGSGATPIDWAVSIGDIEWVYTNNWSFSLWINASDNNDGALFGNKDWTSGGDVGWLVDPSRTTFLNYTCSGAARHDIGAKNILDGLWHNVAAIFDRDTNGVVVYVDGKLNAVAKLGTTGQESLTPDTFSPNDTLVGGSGNGLWSGAGAVDDVGVWTRPLTANEIVSIYAQGLKGQPLTTASGISAVAPVITSEPASETRYEGSTARFSVTATGTAPLSYQWYLGASPVPSATNSALLLSPVTALEAGAYTVVVGNVAGAATNADPAILAVLPLTNVTAGLAVYLNFDSNILAQAGTTNDGVAIGDVGQEEYVPGIVGPQAAFFNNVGSGSTPEDWAVSLGDIEWIYSNSWSFSLWVNATNNTDGGLLGNKDWTSGGDVGWVFDPSRTKFLNYTAAGGPRFDIGGAGILDGNWHHVVAVFDRDTNGVTVYVDGAETAVAKLAVVGDESLTPTDFSPSATLVGSSGDGLYSGEGAVDDLGIWARPLTPNEIITIYSQGLKGLPLTSAQEGAAIVPAIASEPQSLTVLAGFPAVFTISANGSPPLAYQWFQNGSAMAGQTNSSLTVQAGFGTAGAAYTVAVSNHFGSVTSAPPAILTVLPAPASITNGLVIYLNFESNILGQAGTTNDAVATGAVGLEKYTNGIIGDSAALFENDGSASAPPSDWAASFGDVEWIYTNDWSFSLWVNTTDMNPGIAGNKDWNSGGNIGWVLGTTYVDFLNYTAVNSTRHDIGNFDWRDGTWHHVAAVFYRDINTVFAYVDGNLTAQAPLSATGWESLTPDDFSPNDTLIGSSGPGTWSAHALVDDYGIWIRPLSPGEVAAIHQAGLAGKDLTQAVVSTGSPALSAAVAGGNIVVSYPATASAFTLQSSANLAGGAWTAVTNAPVLSGGNLTVTLPIAAGSEFFRLKQ